MATGRASRILASSKRRDDCIQIRRPCARRPGPATPKPPSPTSHNCQRNAGYTHFICGLQRDADGNFYTASGKQGLLRISADGQRVEVLATGFRNPDGLGLLPGGTLTVPCSEGEWTPASMICEVPPNPSISPLPKEGQQPSPPFPRGGQRGGLPVSAAGPIERHSPPHFGYGGPKNGHPPDLPLVYLPRGLDNNSGSQVYISSDRWGPLEGQAVHFSSGAGTHFLLIRDQIDGQPQGAVVPLPGEFLSGVHRGRFNPADGQLYVSGMGGWGTYTVADGCFQRVRYTGEPVQLPCAIHVHQNGMLVTFTRPVERQISEQTGSHFAQAWNYRYGAGYGSPEFSARHRGTRGHDPLAITGATVLADGRSVFLEIPEVQPVNQLYLRLHVDSGPAHDLFATVHRLAPPFTDFSGYRPIDKQIAAHPMLVDLATATKTVPNPWRKPLSGARTITMEAGKNLTFATRTFTVRAGEPIQLTFQNPDVVPHNWVLIKPGTLERVGDLVNKIIAEPDAAARHYVPLTPDVLAYSDIVEPQESFSIYFRAPLEKGRYPYLCTFPGHWMVMNGQMIVE